MTEVPTGVENADRKVEVLPFPQDPKERMNALLSSLNFGPKAVTLLLLPQPGGYISPGELTTRFRSTFQGSEMATMSKTTAQGYTRESLFNLGLVAEEYSIDHFGQKKIVGYGQSEAGQMYGVGTACLVLKTEDENGISLRPFFGSSNTNSQEQVRAPLTRASILRLLSTQSKPVTEVEIARSLGVGTGVVHDAILSLAQGDAITSKIISSRGEEISSYVRGQVAPEQVQMIGTMKSLTNEAVQTCLDLSAKDIEISVQTVLNSMPPDRKTGDQNALRGRLSGVLSNLALQGFLNVGKGFERVGIHAEIRINEFGSKLVTDFLDPLDSLVKDQPDTDSVFKPIVNGVLTDLPRFARVSGDLYFPYSKAAKRRQRTESVGKMKDLLSNPEDSKGFSIRQLASRLGVHENTARDYLQKLRDDDLESEVYRGTNYFKLKSQPTKVA